MNNTEKPAHPQPVVQVKITAMSDGNVNVNGFPTNLSAAMQILSSATQAIVSHFMSEAKAGNVDEAGTIIPKKIIEPQKSALVGADGRPV